MYTVNIYCLPHISYTSRELPKKEKDADEKQIHNQGLNIIIREMRHEATVSDLCTGTSSATAKKHQHQVLAAYGATGVSHTAGWTHIADSHAGRRFYSFL